MINEKSLANLQPLQIGEPARPNAGRPKGARNIKTLIREVLDNYATSDGVDAEQKIWIKATVDAIEGDEKARRDIAAYLYGKPVERIETTEKPETDEDRLARIRKRKQELLDEEKENSNG